MSANLTAAERQAADKLETHIEALRADSNRRAAAEAPDRQTTRRRRDNVIRDYLEHQQAH